MDIEETCICIIGGGPVGTLLSALLSRNYGVSNVVLERDTSIPTDPRAFSLTESGIRCLQAVGLYDKIYQEIGCNTVDAVFISGKHHDINAAPFFRLKFDVTGHLGLTLNLMFDQPTMEHHLRQLVKQSAVGQYRDGCEVIRIEEKEDCAEVTFKDVRTGEVRRLRARFVVGTDGKHGFTRKMYLEPKGIRMEHTDPYEAIYAGGNFNVKVPTPKTHPDFPLWAKGYTPQDVMELFIPEAFHFMCNPDRQCIMSRFGIDTESVKKWRFEFRTLPGEDPAFLSQPEQVRKMIRPYMVHQGSRYGLKTDVVFPENCFEVRRTWHYKFEARTCNKLRLGRVFLAGDAAHVFPPFAGQGIATGFLDVTGLAWRLVLALQSPSKDPTRLFDAWESERRTQIKQALKMTMVWGATFDERSPGKVFWRDWMLWIVQRLPMLSTMLRESNKVTPVYQYAEGMSFMPKLHGGVSFGQVYLRGAGGAIHFSDDLIFGTGKKGLFQLVILLDHAREVAEAIRQLGTFEGPGAQMIEEATVILHDLHLRASELVSTDKSIVVRVASAAEFNGSPLCDRRVPAREYNPGLLKSRHHGRRYIIVRPDRFVFAACRDIAELSKALEAVKEILDFDAI